MALDFRIVAEKYLRALEEIEKYVFRKYGIIKLTLRQDNGQIGWYGTDGVHAVGVWFPLPLIELDFFFDEQGISGYASLWQARADCGWKYTIAFKHHVDDEIECFDFTSRTEALAALWLEEFKILDDRLCFSKSEEGEQ